MSLLAHRLVFLCVDAYCFLFWDLPGDVLAAPESATCAWIGVILLSLSVLHTSLSLSHALRGWNRCAIRLLFVKRVYTLFTIRMVRFHPTDSFLRTARGPQPYNISIYLLPPLVSSSSAVRGQYIAASRLF